jgi:hypothetical protein
MTKGGNAGSQSAELNTLKGKSSLKTSRKNRRAEGTANGIAGSSDQEGRYFGG